MDEKYIKLVESRALSICEEFCRYVVTDEFNKSILTNTTAEYHESLVTRLAGIGYVELFRADVPPGDTITSTFLQAELE